MSTWYHRASWALLRSLYAPSVLKSGSVSARGAESLPDPPFLLLADHANALDPYAIGAFSPYPIRYMANIEGVHPAMAFFAGLIGVYGRRKGANDMAAMRRTISLARGGEAIGLFPEGDRSWDGASAPLRPGAGKLAKRLGLPIVLVRQKGNYLSRPRWASFARRGSWDIEFVVYDADEVARMSEDLVEALIVAALAKNEIKDAIREGRRFTASGPLAEGVGRLLWRCPICGKTDLLAGRGDEIRCLSCLTRWELDANCRVRPLNIPASLQASDIADLKDWHDWQVSTLPELIASGARGAPGLVSEGVALSVREAGGLRRMGKGRLFLSRASRNGEGGSELVFQSRESRVAFEVAAVRGFVDNFNVFSEFSYRGRRWRADFGGGNSAKWAFALAKLVACGAPSRGGPKGEAA
jgi:1-acyl-sn-glycerol-3-phosphate acyltransferase